jgi:cyclase
MSLGEVSQISEGIYAYLQPDGSWYLNNTGFLVSATGVISVDATFVPGHGPVCGPEVIDDVLAYLRFVPDTARQAKAAGPSPLEAARTADLGEFKDLLDSERIVGNLHRAYLELDGAERGAPIDLAPALRDMAAYNDGRPLTCHA